MKRVMIICLVMLFLTTNAYGFYENDIEEENDYFVETTANVSVPNLNARAAILYDVTYDRILYEKNSKQKRANASTTKMITAIVAYENGNLNDTVIVSQKAATTGGSIINLRQGDEITLDDLIKGLLVRSGNDAAVAIAEHIGGNIDVFANLMNEKAQDIGARDTHFVTPHGLDKEAHYSTAYDLMLIAKRLLEIPYLAEIVSKSSVEIKINGYTRNIGNTNEMLSIYQGVTGVKTGYTGEAGRCIITSIDKNNRKLISVVLGCDTKKNRTQDSVKLLDYGLGKFEEIELDRYIKNTICISVEKSDGKVYNLTQNVSFKYLLTKDEFDKINVKYNIKSNLKAPLKKGMSIGLAEIYFDGDKIGEIEYLLPEDIGKKTWKLFFKEIIINSFENINKNTKYS